MELPYLNTYSPSKLDVDFRVRVNEKLWEKLKRLKEENQVKSLNAMIIKLIQDAPEPTK